MMINVENLLVDIELKFTDKRHRTKKTFCQNRLHKLEDYGLRTQTYSPSFPGYKQL